MPVQNEEAALFTFLKLGYGAYDDNLLTFAHYQRWTNMTADFDLVEPDYNTTPAAAVTYTSMPGLKVHPVENNYDLREPVQKIDVPLIPGGFAESLCEELLSPLSVKVFLVVVSVADMATVLDTYTLYHGNMARATSYPQGKPAVRLECRSDKFFMQRSLGIPAHDGCSNIFGGPLCQIGTSAYSSTATISQINGNEIIVVGPGVTSPPFNDYWRFGWVKFDGLQIAVAEYDQSVNSQSLILRRRAPSSWLGQLVTVTPGCNHSRDHCRNRFSNELNYNGLGDYMPSRDVLTEVLP